MRTPFTLYDQTGAEWRVMFWSEGNDGVTYQADLQLTGKVLSHPCMPIFKEGTE